MQIREHALLTTRPTANRSIDVGVISQLTFDWLVELSHEWSRSIRIVYDHGYPAVKLGSLVGYLCSPQGEEIEILPKTRHGVEKPDVARLMLQVMLLKAGNLPQYEAQEAKLLFRNEPIHEWVFGRFLSELQQLVGIGLRQEYKTHREHTNAIRGRIDIVKQMQQRPGNDHLFHVAHDVLSSDLLENRLLKTALVQAHAQCRVGEHWRMSNVLMHQLDSLPLEQAPAYSFDRWSNTRLMQHYSNVKPWCELIVRNMNPDFQKGSHCGISLLFAMEKLFESFVYETLKQSVDVNCEIKKEPRSQYFINSHKGGRLFMLRPDLLLHDGEKFQVMDTKWKLLDESLDSSKDKYGLGQGDFYQLFAYGHRFQKGEGHMMLIYPKHEQFAKPLQPFFFEEKLVLWVVPFCLENQGLVGGEWCGYFPAISSTLDSELTMMSSSKPDRIRY